METLNFTKLNHPADKSFTCGNHSIDKKIKDSYLLSLLDRCYTYEVTATNGVVLAYYQLQFKRFAIDKFPSPIDEYSLDNYEDLYAIHIEYIAVHQSYQHRRIGSFVLKYILATIHELHKNCPFRLVTINALEDKVSWYEEFNFKQIGRDQDDPETILMMIDLISPANLKLLDEYDDTIA